MSRITCNIDTIIKSFNECQKDNQILLKPYMVAYRELNRLFEILGPIFKFVSKDIVSKLDILSNLCEKDENNYETVESMAIFELPNIVELKRDSGSRNLLRLHRALEFIVHFLSLIRPLQADASLSSIAGQSYNETLSKYHSYFIKKAVQLALYTLPVKSSFLSHFTYEEDEQAEISNNTSMNDHMSDLHEACRLVYIATQKIFESRDWLDLS